MRSCGAKLLNDGAEPRVDAARPPYCLAASNPAPRKLRPLARRCALDAGLLNVVAAYLPPRRAAA